MQAGILDNWQTTKLGRTSKRLRSAGSGAFTLLVLVVTLVYGAMLGETLAGIALLIALWLVAVYDAHFIYQRGLRWNDAQIQQTGTLWPARAHDWQDLTDITTSMKKRATIMTFGRRRSLAVYWGFEAHRELCELAERKLTDARTS
ncbi:MAG: hypothetical protein V2I76_12015 [Roseobacter sp.]|jgi:hypothetical protein|nr:hypothetical protein [Roseobacter sp.]